MESSLPESPEMQSSRKEEARMKLEVVLKIVAQETTVRIEATRLSLSLNTVKSWVKQYKDGHFVGVPGKPKRISTPVREEVRAFISSGPTCPTKEAVNKKIQETVQKFESERKNEHNYHFQPVSQTTLWRGKKEMHIEKGYAAPQTAAREKACADVLNCASFAAACHLMVPKVHPALNLNVDASIMAAGYNSEKKFEVNYLKEEGQVRGNLKANPVQEKSSGINLFFIKYYCCISAAGYAARPVLIIADDRMKEGEIDVHRVAGLGVSTSPGSYGYIVFCKSRTPPQKFFEWFFEGEFIHFVRELRAQYNLPISSPGFFQMDGEGVQIACFKTEKIMKLFEEEAIVVGKPPGSLTEIAQACDNGDCFRGTKGCLKSITDAHVSYDKEMLERLQAVWEAHEKSEHVERGRKMPANHKKCGMFGVLRILMALRKNLNGEVIYKGFENCGIYDREEKGYNLKTIMKNCTTKLNRADGDKFVAAIPILAQQLGQKGELLHEHFMAHEIFRKYDTGSKDDRIVAQRRFVFLTHKELFERERRKEEEKKKKEEEKIKAREAKVKAEEEARAKAEALRAPGVKKHALKKKFYFSENARINFTFHGNGDDEIGYTEAELDAMKKKRRNDKK
jgi:hypothetical protein